VIRCENLEHSYAEPVLRGISFEVPAGQVLGYLGPNGAGKTTTIRILTGQLTPQAGKVELAGVDVLAKPEEAKRLLGYVPEQAALYEELTPREFLDLVAALHDLEPRRAAHRAREYLEFFDLSDRMDDRMNTFSKGMRKKVVISAALLHDPKVLFLDEPLDGLDANAALQLKELLRQLAGSGVAVLYSSHVLDVVEKVCDRVVILHEGRIVLDGPMEDVRQRAGGKGLEDLFAAQTGTLDPRLRAERFFARLTGERDDAPCGPSES